MSPLNSGNVMSRYTPLKTGSDANLNGVNSINYSGLPVAKQSKRNWCQEHYCRLPDAASVGLIKHPVLLGMEIFFLVRVLTVYDTCTDIAVMLNIDPDKDPMWKKFSICFILLPVVLRVLMFWKLMIAYVLRFCNTEQFCLRLCANILYLLLSPFLFALSDLWMLLLYPWVSPSNPTVGTVERLSPILQGLFEAPLQIGMQIYMFVRLVQLDRGTDHDKYTKTLLICSVGPGILSLGKKLYDLKQDANASGMALGPYMREMVKAALGLGAPFLEQLGRSAEFSYAEMGPLPGQEQIFDAVGEQNTELKELSFSHANKLELGKLWRSVQNNQTLRRIELGNDYTPVEFLEFVKAVRSSDNALKMQFKAKIILNDHEYAIADFDDAAILKSEVGFSAHQLNEAYFTAKQLEIAGFTAQELKDAGFTAEALVTAGFTAEDLKDVGFKVGEIVHAGSPIKQIQDAGITITEIQDAGFNLAALKSAGMTAGELRDCNFSLKELKDVGFSVWELRNAGFSMAEFKDAGFKASHFSH